MSVGRSNNVPLKLSDEEEYRINQARIDEAQAAVDKFRAMNEAAKIALDKKKELLDRIEAGKEAERQLLALSNASSSQQTRTSEPMGQPKSPATGHGGTWQPASSHHDGGRFKHYKNTNTYNVPQQQPYQAASSSSFNYDQLQWTKPTSASTSTIIPERTPSREPVKLGNNRVSSSTMRQSMPMVQRRQPLPMQPVTRPMLLNSNQFQTLPQTAHASTMPSNSSSHHGIYQYGLQAPASYGAAIPNFVPPQGSNQPSKSRAHVPNPPTFSGTLDSTKKTTTSELTPSSSVVQVNAPTTASNIIGDTAERLHEQIMTSKFPPNLLAVSNISSTNGDKITSLGPSFGASHLAPLTAENLAPHYRNLVSDASRAEWLETLVEKWQSKTPLNSYLPLPNSTFIIAKAVDSNVYIVHTDPETQKSDYLPFTLFKDLKRSAPSNAIDRDTQRTEQLSQGISTTNQIADRQSLNDPQTQAQRHGPGSGVPSQSGPTTTAQISGGFGGSPSLHSPIDSLRTPKQVDKKRLAKDILRALNTPPLKRPQFDGSSAQVIESSTEQPSSSKGIAGVPSLPTGDRPAARTITTESQQQPTQRPSQAPQAALAPAPLAVESAKSNYGGNHYQRHVWEGVSRGPSSSGPDQSNSFPTFPPSHPSASSNLSTSLAERPTDGDKVGETSTSTVQLQLPVVPTPPQQQIPLFLPSPSSSPARTPNEMGSNSTIELRRPSQRFYIFVPPLPDYARRYKAQQLGRKRRRISAPIGSGPESVVEVESFDAEEDIENIDISPASTGFVNDDNERQAVLLSCSRLSERPCKWNGCGAIMGSAEKLIQHLASQHRQQSTFKDLRVCMWQQCGQHEGNTRELFQHTKSHALLPLWCAYQDCQESFRTPRQLAKHHSSIHGNGELKPSVSPFTPAIAPPPHTPAVVPSYLLEPIGQSIISRERHAKLGQFVLQHIAGPVSRDIRPYNAASKLPQSSGGGEKGSGNQRYDFLSFPSANFSTRPSRPSRLRDVEDLDSGEISELVSDGLVLWPAPGVQKEEVVADDIEQPPVSPTTEAKSEEVELEMASGIEPRDHHHDVHSTYVID